MKAIHALVRISLAVMLMLHVAGCASIGAAYGGEALYNAAFREKITDPTKLSADEQSKLQQVQVLALAPGADSAPKGRVVGLSCKLTVAVFVFKWVWKPELNETNGLTPEEAARTQVRIKAMQAGANAVVAPTCTHKDGIDWGNNCFESWQCAAQAFVIP